MSSGHVPLPFDGDDAPAEPVPPDAPCVYVATRITGTDPGSPERQIIDFAVTAISEAVDEATRGSQTSWYLRVHAPVEWTAPEQTPDLTPSEIFLRNANHVLVEAAALIVFGWSPSAGVGQEVTWAALTGLPVLYVEPPGHHVSRQIAGTPGDVTIVRYSAPDSLKDEVRRWIRSRRHQIEAGEARRRDRVAALGDLHQGLGQRWAVLDQDGRRRVAAHAGVTPSLLEWWLGDATFLAVAPMAQILLLTAVLTGSTDAVVGRHELSINQLEALLTARDEHEWDDATTEAVRRRGESELAQPAVRRFKLDGPEDWARLYEVMKE